MFNGIKNSFRSLRKEYRIKHYANISVDRYPAELKKIYKQMTGLELNLDDPKRYTEKIQWFKLYGVESIHSKLADKYAVREWVKNRVGEEILIPCYGIFSSFEEIDFDSLPDKFVLKTTNNCGTNIIVRDKSFLDIKKARKQVDKWMREKYFFANGFEMQYASIQPRIIIEKLIEAEDGLPDYKFLCFDGHVYCIYIMSGRADGFEEIKMGIVDRDFNLLPYKRKGHAAMESAPPKPENYNKMIDIVERLAEGFSHVRVDLYNVNGQIYFGEMTFTSGGGMVCMIPMSLIIFLERSGNLILSDASKINCCGGGKLS